MSQELQDVTVDTPTDVESDNDVKVEKSEEVVTEETEEKSTPENDNEETEGNEETEVQETVEERAERLSHENKAMQKSIDRKTASFRQREKNYQQKLQELEANQTEIAQQKPAEEPKIEDFDTHAEYVDAVAEHKAKSMLKERQQKQLLDQQKAEATKIAQERENIREEQESEYILENPHYEASKEEFASFVEAGGISPQVEQAFVYQAFKGNVPEIIDYFGSNNGERMEELEAISKMHPIEAAVEVYKIQNGLSKTPKVKEDKKPAAKPLKKVKGSAAPRKDLHKGDVLVNLGLKQV